MATTRNSKKVTATTTAAKLMDAAKNSEAVNAAVTKRAADAKAAKALAAATKAKAAAEAAAAAVAAPAKELSYHEKQEAMKAQFIAKGGTVTEAPSVTLAKSESFGLYKVASYDSLSADHGVKLGYFRGYTIAAFVVSGYIAKVNDVEGGSTYAIQPNGDYTKFCALTRAGSSDKASAPSTAAKTFEKLGAFSKGFKSLTVEGINKISASLAGLERYSTTPAIVDAFVKAMTVGGKQDIDGREFSFIGVASTRFETMAEKAEKAEKRASKRK